MRIHSKGTCSPVLYLNRVAKELGLLLNPDSLVNANDERERNLGVAVIDKISSFAVILNAETP